MSSPQRHTSSILAIGATCAVGLVMYGLYIRHRNAVSLHKTTCTLPQDLHHNASAKGSDVVNIYRQCISKKDIYVITGATSGLGREMALLLARAGANLILAVRNTQQGKHVKQEILQSQTNNATGTIHVWYLDLSSLESVRAFVEKWKKESGPHSNDNKIQPRMRIAGLINNAGVYRVKGTTVDGFQTTWQVNAMAPALLTELLLPFMSPTARIVNVSSELHRLVYHVANNCPPSTNGASMYDYALSKACQVLHAHELTLRFHQKNDQRRAVAVEPGLVHTNIARHDSPLLKWFQYQALGPFILKSVDQGCATALYCLLSPDLEDTQDYFFANCAPKSPTKCSFSLDEVYAQKNLFEQVWNA